MTLFWPSLGSAVLWALLVCGCGFGASDPESFREVVPPTIEGLTQAEMDLLGSQMDFFGDLQFDPEWAYEEISARCQRSIASPDALVRVYEAGVGSLSNRHLPWGETRIEMTNGGALLAYRLVAVVPREGRVDRDPDITVEGERWVRVDGTWRWDDCD